jgi:hypothetical protein
LKELSANGYLCDLWNEGLFIAVIDNDFPFYQLNRSSSLSITSSYSLDFDVAHLPAAAKDLIEKNLKKMKLTNLHGNQLSLLQLLRAKLSKPQ